MQVGLLVEGINFKFQQPSAGYSLSCYVKDNMDWEGGDAYREGNVLTLAACMGICRERDIKNFIWVRSETRCVCKNVVSGENQGSCCISGHATGDACESEPTT